MGEGTRIALCLSASALSAVLLQRLALTHTPQAALGESTAGAPSVYSAAPFPWGDALAALVGMLAGALFLLLTSRPLAAALLTLALLALLTLVNRAKVRILREPLVLADAWLLTQVFRYPHLYFPFLPVKILCLTAGGVFLCVMGLLVLETPLASTRSAFPAFVLAVSIAAPCLTLFLLWKGRFAALGGWLLARCPVRDNAVRDAARCGPLCAALLHPVAAGKIRRENPDFLRSHAARPAQSAWPAHFTRFLDTPPPGEPPHVVLIQAESLCDIRNHLPEPQKSALAGFLPHWDALHRAGRTLPTPETAFGAYTMRTEFSMLTGLGPDALGPFFFNPYLLAARQPLWSIARHFQRQGYRTLCVHPYAKDFFRRDKVMPNLGFERFLGIESLGHLERFGPYAGDTALAEYIRDELRRSTEPVFCFVITMEAHGPWLTGRLTEREIEATLQGINRGLFSPEMQLYLCHLRHMDDMMGLLGNASLAGKHRGPIDTPPAQKPESPEDKKTPRDSANSRSSVLWVYGDHAPGCVVSATKG